MALGKYLSINSEQLPNPNPGTFSFDFNPVENVYTSESGTEMSNITRLDRPSWSASFNCTSTWKDKLLGFCKLAGVTCVYNGTTYTGRLRLSGCKLVEDSENTAGTDGLWVVSVDFQGE